jgi:hypothetical protein
MLLQESISICKKQEIDLGKFGQGTYLINIRNNNEVTTKKIIVAN